MSFPIPTNVKELLSQPVFNHVIQAETDEVVLQLHVGFSLAGVERLLSTPPISFQKGKIQRSEVDYAPYPTEDSPHEVEPATHLLRAYSEAMLSELTKLHFQVLRKLEEATLPISLEGFKERIQKGKLDLESNTLIKES